MSTTKGVAGSFEGAHVRTQDGRKIDSWRYRTAEGEDVAIEVAMIIENGAPLFRARACSGFARGQIWQDADIAALQSRAAADLEAQAQAIAATAWRPAALTGVSSHSSVNTGMGPGWRWSLTVEAEPVLLSPETGGRNDGMVTVVRKGIRQDVFTHDGQAGNEADIWQPTPGSGARGIVEALRRRPEPGRAVAVVETVPEWAGDGMAAPGLKALAATLEAFGGLLTEAMAPGRIAVDGLPHGQRLVGMMEEAVQKAARQDSAAHADKAAETKNNP